MGIDNIQLTPDLIASLYPESLVDGSTHITAAKQATAEKSVSLFKHTFLGKNNRSICFLVNASGSKFLPEDQLAFLTKILTACKLSPDDIALVNTASQRVTMAELKTQFKPRIVFLWGSPLPEMPEMTELPDSAVSSVEDFLVVPVEDAFLMDGDHPQGPVMKQKLWATLKKLFTH